MEKQKSEILQSIVCHLMLHSSNMKDVGLLEGKLGAAIFFFQYSTYTNKKIYSDFGEELVDDLCNEIHENYPLNFKNGLSGIVWGIEYLIRNKYIEADTDEVLEELDKKILEWDVRRITDISLETGLAGLAYYVINHYSSNNNKSNIPKEYIADLVSSLKLKMNNTNENYQVIEDLTALLSGRQILNFKNPLPQYYKDCYFQEDSLSQTNYPLGILNNGLASVGLNLMEIQ